MCVCVHLVFLARVNYDQFCGWWMFWVWEYMWETDRRMAAAQSYSHQEAPGHGKRPRAGQTHCGSLDWVREKICSDHLPTSYIILHSDRGGGVCWFWGPARAGDFWNNSYLFAYIYIYIYQNDNNKTRAALIPFFFSFIIYRQRNYGLAAAWAKHLTSAGISTT